ncbi:MAG TPA: DUF3619 family protein [Rubrivivax sp.]|nr:DUF3619 family protein [Rubrivivax sp.]
MTARPTFPAMDPATRLEHLEARLAARMAAGLSERAAAVPHDVGERLRIGRERALNAARQRRQARERVPAAALAGRGAGALAFGPGGLWRGLVAALPLLVLVLGLALIQHWISRERVLAAAEIDASLLSDDLPPAAWADPGFREFLRAPKP